MFMKYRGIAVLMATLIAIVPAGVISAQNNGDAAPTNANRLPLASFVRAIIDASPEVNAARAALDASTAFEGAAGRPLYNPELEFEFENADSETRAIGISQTIDWGGKRRARTSLAESERRSVEADYIAVRWQVAIDLMSALAGHQTESDRRALAGVRVDTMQDFATLAQRRFDIGDISQIELNLAMLANTQARMQKATAAANVAEARQAVTSIAIGSPSSEWPQLETTLPAIVASSADAQEFVMRLPDVRAAQFQVAAAAALVELRRRERRLDPTITLRGGKEDDENLVGVNVTVPIPIRNRFTYEVTAASAARRQAQQSASDVMRRAYARFTGALERYQLSRDAWQDWEDTGNVSLRRQTELLRRLWEAGELSTTDFLVQITQTLDTGESALELRQAMWRAWFEWLTASGQLREWLGPEAIR
ncbi:MAG: TolC family protein [Gammaproteobacteria bacterium]|nr:MAG: TolC family protein [Gammaproteobacteria bacterium]RLA37119.1 MAG: TolC family protein [Gammaproteobacteria bacterium]